MQEKQIRFVEEYLVDLNATQAALRAGYSAKTAGCIGWENLKKPEIQAAIKAAQKQRLERLGVRADRVLEEAARLAFVDVRRLYDVNGDLLPVTDLDDETAAAVAGLEVLEEWRGRGDDRELVGHTKKIRLWNKLEGLTLLAKHLRLLQEGDSNNERPLITINVIYGNHVQTSLV